MYTTIMAGKYVLSIITSQIFILATIFCFVQNFFCCNKFLEFLSLIFLFSFENFVAELQVFFWLCSTNSVWRWIQYWVTVFCAWFFLAFKQKRNSVSHRLGRIALKLKNSKNKKQQHENHGLEPRFNYPSPYTIMNLSCHERKCFKNDVSTKIRKYWIGVSRECFSLLATNVPII